MGESHSYDYPGVEESEEDKYFRQSLPQYEDPRCTIYRLQTIIIKQDKRIRELEQQASDRLHESIRHNNRMSTMMVKSLLSGTDPRTFILETPDPEKK